MLGGVMIADRADRPLPFAGNDALLVAAIAEQPGARVHGAGRKAARARAAAGPIGVDRVIVEKVRGLAA